MSWEELEEKIEMEFCAAAADIEVAIRLHTDPEWRDMVEGKLV